MQRSLNCFSRIHLHRRKNPFLPCFFFSVDLHPSALNITGNTLWQLATVQGHTSDTEIDIIKTVLKRHQISLHQRQKLNIVNKTIV